MAVARREEQAGASSEGFRTTAFPAATAPINGSKEIPTTNICINHSVFI